MATERFNNKETELFCQDYTGVNNSGLIVSSGKNKEFLKIFKTKPLFSLLELLHKIHSGRTIRVVSGMFIIAGGAVGL